MAAARPTGRAARPLAARRRLVRLCIGPYIFV